MEENKRFKDIDISGIKDNDDKQEKIRTNTNRPNLKGTTNEDIDLGELENNLVLFIGPKSVGKTVALMRLTLYLENKRIVEINPNRNFRTGTVYQDAIDDFLDDLHDTKFSPNRTSNVNFLVLDAVKNGESYCQFLEAPGEAYFDIDNPYSEEFPAYIEDILGAEDSHKVFVFFFENGMFSEEGGNAMQIAYSKRISLLVANMRRKKDDIIIVYNKCDNQKGLYRNAKPNVKAFKNKLYRNSNYNNFFSAVNKAGIPVKFIPFSSGKFINLQDSNKKRWAHSIDTFPKDLWRNIDSCFNSWKLW